jgi:tripartite ATP-independent transporter DctM subunit
MTIPLVVAALFLLLAIGAPVGFAMGLSGALGLLLTGGVPMLTGVLAATSISAVSSYELITIPMFLLLAEFVLQSGIAEDLFLAAAAWVGWVPGGLGMATALAGAGFGAVCGSSTASAATLSSTSLPAMLRQGYEPSMASGVVAISGTLATLLPTSISLVLYGILANVNLGKLLISGIVPAMVVTLTIIATIYILVRLDPTRAPRRTDVPLRVKLELLGRVWPMIMLFGMISGVIYTGVATPTEASAVGALAALAIAVSRGRMGPRQLLVSARRAAQNSCMIAMILLGAGLFSYFFTLAQVTQELVAWAGALPVNRWTIMVGLLCGYILLGSFMDQAALLVLTVPIVVPMIKTLGFDPIWFGVVKTVTAEVGLITPPIGLNCFVVARCANRPIGEVFRGTLPHFIAHLVAIASLLIFPQLVTWLPMQMDR